MNDDATKSALNRHQRKHPDCKGSDKKCYTVAECADNGCLYCRKLMLGEALPTNGPLPKKYDGCP